MNDIAGADLIGSLISHSGKKPISRETFGEDLQITHAVLQRDDIRLTISNSGNTPVSYTHLDVYKRQDEDYVHDLLDFCTKVGKSMIDMYVEVGMDVIAVVDPLVSQISVNHFEEFFAEPFTQLFDYIREKGVFSSFFVCGDATRNIEAMCKTGPDSIHAVSYTHLMIY